MKHTRFIMIGLLMVANTAIATNYSPATRTAHIAIETDHEFWQAFYNSDRATAYIGDLIAYLSTITEREVGVNLVVTYLRLWPTATDPWTATDAGVLLDDLNTYWNANMGAVSRSFVFMLSGRDYHTGGAKIDTLCDVANAYGISTNIPGAFNPNNPIMTREFYIIAHEMGHIFGAHHTQCYNSGSWSYGNPEPVDKCNSSEGGCYAGPYEFPCPQGPGNPCGTLMSYCGAGLPNPESNYAFAFGEDFVYGNEPGRVPRSMRDFTAAREIAYPTCLTFQCPEWPRKINSNGAGGSCCCCRGDANKNGFVNTSDFAEVQINFGRPAVRSGLGDADCNGFVNSQDFAAVQLGFGRPCVNSTPTIPCPSFTPPATPTPTPTGALTGTPTRTPTPRGRTSLAVGGYGGFATDQGTGIAIDHTGAHVITGYSAGGANGVDFGAGIVSEMGFFLAKYAADGSYQWAIFSGGSQAQNDSYRVAIDSTNNIFITGRYFGTVALGGSCAPIVSAGNGDIFLAKYNSAGVCQWVKATGSTALDSGMGVAIDSSDNVLFTGFFRGVINLGGSPLTSGFSTNNDIFVAKYANDGTHTWSKNFNNNNLNTAQDFGYGIAVDTAGNLYVVGTLQGSVPFDPPNLTTSLNAGASISGYIVKLLGSNGAFVWVREWGDNSTARGVTTDSSNNVTVVGTLGIGVNDFTGDTLTTTTPSVGFAASWTASGTWRWNRAFQSACSSDTYGVAVSPFDKVLVTGSDFSAAGGHTTEFGQNETLITTCGGTPTIYVASYEPDGVFRWFREIGSSGVDVGRSVAADTLTVRATGYFTGKSVDFGSGFLLNDHGINPNNDVFVIELAP